MNLFQLNLFQKLTLPAVIGLLLWELVDSRRRRVSPGFWLFRCIVWTAAAVAIADPALVQDIATAMGIGRGTDAILYLFVLLFLATSFYFYWQKVVLQRQITILVRHLAIREAQLVDNSRPGLDESIVTDAR